MKYKEFLLAISGIIAAIPGIPVLMNSGLLPHYAFNEKVYGAVIEILSLGTFALIYLNIKSLATIRKSRLNLLVVVSIVVFLSAFVGYIKVYSTCNVFQDDHYGGMVFMPLHTTGDLQQKIEEYGSREALLNGEPTLTPMYIDSMPGISKALFNAFLLHLVLYFLLFISISFLFGLLAVLFVKGGEQPV